MNQQEDPKLDRFYELPKVMDKPTNLGELSNKIEGLRTYVPNVNAVSEMRVERCLQGRMKGHIKRITDKQVAKQ